MKLKQWFTNNNTKAFWSAVVITLVLAVLTTTGLGYYSLNTRIFPFITKIILTAFFIYLAKDTKYLKAVLIVLLLIALVWIGTGTGLRYGRLNSLAMSALMGTDQLETIEFVKALPVIYPLLALLFVVLSWVLLRKLSLKNALFSYRRAVLVLLLMYFSSFGAFLVRFVEEYRSFMHEKEVMTAALEQEANWQIQSVNPRYKVHVVVMGESVIKDYMSVYGYRLPTTPFLDAAPISYVSNYVSPAPYTYPSLSRSFSINQGKTPDPVNHAVTLANAAGFETYWLSNQGYLGETDTRVASMAARSKHIFFLKKGSYNSVNIDDIDLFPHIKEALNETSDRPKVIFVHIMGSHQRGCERLFDFPNRFNEGKGKSFDCYLATLQKTDAFLQTVVDMLNQHGESYSLLYFSDHGVNIESDRKLLAASTTLGIYHGNKHQQNFSVPLLWMSSDQHDRRMIDKTLSGFDFIHIYANWLGITEPRLKPEFTLEGFPSNNDPVVFDGDKTHHYNALPNLPLQ